MIKLIYGKLNAANRCNYWLLNPITEGEFIEETGDEVGAGDYAIVSNRSDYDLVKIIAIVKTEPKYVRYLVGDGIKVKSVISLVPREMIRED